MKPFLILFVLFVSTTSICNAVDEINEKLQASCAIDGEEYVVRVTNTSRSKIEYWIIPRNERSVYFKVPVGAEIFIDADGYDQNLGLSSLIYASEALKAPVELEALRSGETIEYRFKLRRLYGEIVDLRPRKESSKVRIKIRVKIYTAKNLASFITCESEWVQADQAKQAN